MMPTDDTRLAEYILGLLDKDAREAVEQELETSPEAHAAMVELDELFGTAAATAEPVAPSPWLRERLLASLEPRTRFEGFKERLATLFDLDTTRIRELLDAVDLAPAAPWEESGIPGTRLLHFAGGPRVANADCGLVHVEPGRKYFPHRHLGHEWVLVIQGEAREDGGRLFEPGDLIHMEPGSVHGFCTLGDRPFIFALVLFEGIELVRGR